MKEQNRHCEHSEAVNPFSIMGRLPQKSYDFFAMAGAGHA